MEQSFSDSDSMADFQKPTSSKNLNDQLIVLIVDDNDFELYLAKKTLKEFNSKLNIVTCNASNEAVKIARHSHFDLIITDVKMGKGNLDGFELTEMLRKSGNQSFIFIHTSGNESENLQLAKQAGAN